MHYVYMQSFVRFCKPVNLLGRSLSFNDISRRLLKLIEYVMRLDEVVHKKQGRLPQFKQLLLHYLLSHKYLRHPVAFSRFKTVVALKITSGFFLIFGLISCSKWVWIVCA